MNVKLLDYLQKKKREKVHFSLHAMTDLKRLAAAVGDIAGKLSTSMEGESERVGVTGDLKTKIEEIRVNALEGHIKRMKTGHCSIESGLLFSDMIATMVSLSECSSNIVRVGSSIK